MRVRTTAVRASDSQEGFMPEIAIGALLRDGAVLLARRSAERKVHASLWSLPGGHVNIDETPANTMRRELLEEIGVTAEQWRFVSQIRLAAALQDSGTFHLYRVDEWRGIPQILDDEHTELRWFTASEIACETELAPPELGELLIAVIHSGG